MPDREQQKTGQPRVDDRAAFSAIMCVLVTGIACDICRGAGLLAGDR